MANWRTQRYFGTSFRQGASLGFIFLICPATSTTNWLKKGAMTELRTTNARKGQNGPRNGGLWESRIPRHIQITSGVIYVLLRLTLMPVLQGGLHQQPSQNSSGALKKKTWRALRLFSQSQSPVSGIAEYFFTSKKK